MTQTISKILIFVTAFISGTGQAADVVITWMREASMIKFRYNGGPKYEYDYFRWKDSLTSAVIGYHKYTSWVNPNHSWYCSTPGPAYTEDSDWSVVTSPSNFLEYTYRSRWGVYADIATTGGAVIDVEMDYRTVDVNGNIGSIIWTKSESKTVGPGIYPLLWATFHAPQADHVNPTHLSISY